MNVREITFTVERDEESGWFTASWDAPNQTGGITTQGKDLAELEKNLREAVECHFDGEKLTELPKCSVAGHSVPE